MSPDQADKQAAALLTASAASPLRQVRYELYARGKEWERVAGELRDILNAGGRADIEVASAVTPQMRVIGTDREGEEWLPVVKVNPSRDGGQVGFMIESEGRPIWRNALGPMSPVVVKA